MYFSSRFLFSIFFLIFIFITTNSVKAFSDREKKNNPDSSITYLYVRNIIIIGNRRTRLDIILREITFKQGDSIAAGNLNSQIELSREHIFNLSLFNAVNYNIKNWSGDSLDIVFTVVERFYTFPLPLLAISDRNFNTWWVEHDHDLNRLQYGIRFMQQNLTGRNDNLSINVIFGFSENFKLSYDLPFVNANQTIGIGTTVQLWRYKSVTWGTLANSDETYTDFSRYLVNQWNYELRAGYQPGFHFKNQWAIDYGTISAADTLAKLDSSFFLRGINFLHFFTLRTTLTYDHLDIEYYPLHGYWAQFTAQQQGIFKSDNVKLFTASLAVEGNTEPVKKIFLSSYDKIKFSAPVAQPYYLQRGLGYNEDYVSGYEYYIIDGQDFYLTRNTLKYQLLNKIFHLPFHNAIIKDARLPIAIYPKIYCDLGYVNDQYYFAGNPLNNTLLIGYGFGIDVVTFYSASFRLEYSFNKMGQNGLFLHFNALF